MPLVSSQQQLEDSISAEQFSQLVDMFHKHGEWQRSTGTTRLTTDDFRRILAKLLSHSEDDEEIVLLCNKVFN